MITVKNLLAQKAQKTIRWATATDSVQKVLEMMRDHTVRSAVVLDEGRLIGIVSERDCALKVLLNNRQATDTTVGEIMTREVVTVSENDSLDHCMLQMTSKNIRHLPVCSNRTVVGMVSVGDIVKEVIRQQAEHISYLEGYIKGHGVS